jgi:hypothetical protein
MVNLDKNDVIKLGATGLYRLGRATGLTHTHLHHLLNELAWSGGSSVLGPKATVRWLCAYAYVAMGCDIEKHVGTRSYQALSTTQELTACFNAYALYQSLNPSTESGQSVLHP